MTEIYLHKAISLSFSVIVKCMKNILNVTKINKQWSLSIRLLITMECKMFEYTSRMGAFFVDLS